MFQSLRKAVPAGGRLLLTTNFRSQPAILNSVNCLFAPSMGSTFDPLIPHDAKQLSPTPAIEFLFPAIESEDERSNAIQRRSVEADWIARRVAAFLNDGTQRIRTKTSGSDRCELRSVKKGDIAILFRSLNNVHLYEEALRRYGIDYYLVGGRAFFAQQEVYDVINLCQYLYDGDDEISLTGVLRSPMFSFSDDTLFSLVRESVSLADCFFLNQKLPADLSEEQSWQVDFARRVLSELRHKKDRLPIAELLALTLERTGYDAALLNEFLGRRKLANLKKLIDMARQFDRSGLFTLKDFVIRMRESIVEQADEDLAATHPESSDVVRLMTVHQSKGLEFPIVFVADTDWRPRPNRPVATFHPEFGPVLPLPKVQGERAHNLAMRMQALEEESENTAETVRLLYVALTRAADYLILPACRDAIPQKKSPWLSLVSSVFDLQTGLLTGEPYLGRLPNAATELPATPEILIHRGPPSVRDATNSENHRRLPITQFRSAVAAAAACDVPVLYRRFPADRSSRRQFSASEIEAVDAELRGLHIIGRVTAREGPRPPRYDKGNSQDLSRTQQLGDLVHAVLEQIDFADPKRIDATIDKWTRSQSSPISEDVQRIAKTRISVFSESGLWSEIVNSRKWYRELEFLIRRPLPEPGNGTVKIQGIIDCLFETANGKWVVVDYKTGRHPTTQTDVAILAEYEIQLSLYALAAKHLLTRLPDRIELALLQDEFRTIPFHLDDAVIESLEKRIDAAISHLRTPMDQ